jgi:branched-subunit amino acid ABC-type transport system permease component
MPRQIIDVESSRPAYVRRRIRRLLLVIIVVVLVAATVWFLARTARGEESHAAAGTQGRECCLSLL